LPSAARAELIGALRVWHVMEHRMILVRRSLVAGAILALAQVVPALAQSGTPPGSIGIRLLEAPEHLADDPRARLYVIDHLNQGDTIRRRIEVSSGLDHVERLRLYAAGALVSKGAFRFLEGRTQNELSSWITVDPPSVDVSPHGSVTALVTIAVPNDAADGERYAVVWAETPPSSPSSEGVVTVDRVGIRIYLSVGRGGAPPTDFRIEFLTAARDDAGRPIVSATVLNTGGRAIDLNGTLRLIDGPGGLSAGPFPVELGTTIGIGQRGTVRIVLSPSIPDGPWTAELRLRSDLVRRQARAEILFPSRPGGRSAPVPATPSDGSLALVAVIVAIGLALVAGLWLLFVLRRRRRSDSDREGKTEPAGISSGKTRV
jgi:hypothetical protein